MQVRPSVVRVAPGDALAARFADIVIFTDARGDAATRLLAAAEAATVHPGDTLPDRLGPVVFDAAASDAVAAVASTEAGLLVLVHGPVVAMVENGGASWALTGSYGYTWVSDTVRGESPTVSLSLVGATRPTVHPLSDLRSGAAPAGGVVIVGVSEVAETVAAARPTVDTVAAARPVEPTVAFEAPATAKSRPAEPRPSDGIPTTRFSGPDETVLSSAFTRALVGPDGAIYPIDRTYVIGRAPLSDDAVRTAAAAPISVSNDPYMSRVHAYVSLQGADVYVRDAGTSSGTFIAAPGAYSWTRVGVTPTRVDPGWSLRIGEWIAICR